MQTGYQLVMRSLTLMEKIGENQEQEAEEVEVRGESLEICELHALLFVGQKKIAQLGA